MENTYIGISGDQLAHLTRRVLVEFLVLAKDEDGDIDGAEDGEFVSLLEETALALQKGAVIQGHPVSRRWTRMAGRHDGTWRRVCDWEVEVGVVCLHRTISVILDGFYFNLPATHCEVDDADDEIE